MIAYIIYWAICLNQVFDLNTKLCLERERDMYFDRKSSIVNRTNVIQIILKIDTFSVMRMLSTLIFLIIDKKPSQKR